MGKRRGASGLEISSSVLDQGCRFPFMAPWKTPRRLCTGHTIPATECKPQADHLLPRHSTDSVVPSHSFRDGGHRA